MNTLKIDFENCYGINRLKYEFDFSEKRVYSIYSPNGIMKTSFAKTFIDLIKGDSPCDKIYPDREPKCLITEHDGSDIILDQIFVIENYIKKYQSEKMSTLLVNDKLKTDYENAHKAISDKKSLFYKELQKLAGLKRTVNIENTICDDFENKDIYNLFESLESEIIDNSDSIYSSIIYNKIFNEKAYGFLKSGELKNQIQGYIKKYDELLLNSKYLKKGFNHFNAFTVQKSLKDNGFFAANHSINLAGDTESRKIDNEKDLLEVINHEIEEVMGNEELKKEFDAIGKKLTNVSLKELCDYLEDHQEVLPELQDLEAFKRKIWISYFIDQKTLFKDLLIEYHKRKKEIESIIIQANLEETSWKSVIDIFNERFSVPFILEVENQSEVLLKSSHPSIKYTYQDRDEPQIIEKDKLLELISQGEKRAFYILNIIFEVEARKILQPDTLFIVDDIADSFDYKNKYAIIEYLSDISKDADFKIIILTHNYDFHRTVCGRLDMTREYKLISIKNNTEIFLEKEHYQNDPFKVWKNNLHQNNSMLIASIPFVRNLADYMGNDTIYNELTSLLHIKSGTNNYDIGNLEDAFLRIIGIANNLPNHSRKVIDLIFSEASIISQNTDNSVNLEYKIVMSIAIRLKAEQYMISEINDPVFLEEIKHKSNQTRNLYKKFIGLFTDKINAKKILHKVNLMTPENIHLNSFMFEPILDMDILHLQTLYQEVIALST
ncbi:MAG: hypothetical protein P9M05_03615 [Candidatus Stygibacter australis]|nr:hypothetical protein [Candidatus Stygibacter australis]